MPYEPEVLQPMLFRDLDELGASRRALARLGDLDENNLTRAANGQRNLSWPEFKQARATLDEMIAFKVHAGAIPIDWTDLPAIRKNLHEMRSPLAPLSAEESALLSRFARGVPLDDLSRGTNLAPEELLKHLETLLARSARLAAAAKQQSAEKNGLI